MADVAPPSAATMDALYRQVGRVVRESGVTSAGMKAGCGKCGACSALSAYEGAA
jgi:biotin synthase-related radical SAM superfamily protein